MKRIVFLALVAAVAISTIRAVLAGQAPGAASAPDIPIALSGASAGTWDGVLARPSYDRRRFDRLQFRLVHRYRDQHGEAHNLRWPLAARGVLLRPMVPKCG